jgi:hypothetical protein
MLRSCTDAPERIACDRTGVAFFDEFVLRDGAVFGGRAELQAAIGGGFDLIERQAADVDQLCRRLDIELHQIELRRPAGEQANRGTLLRRGRLRGQLNGRSGRVRCFVLKQLHGLFLLAGRGELAPS